MQGNCRGAHNIRHGHRRARAQATHGGWDGCARNAAKPAGSTARAPSPRGGARAGVASDRAQGAA